MFPNYESQLYRFEFSGINMKVVHYDGNYAVYTAECTYMPEASGDEWYEEDDDSLHYWVGVVYGYKVTDDTTLNVYTCADYADMAYACYTIDQVPDFEILEPMIGYSNAYGSNARLTRESIANRAKAWLALQATSVHPLAEGAD